MHAPSPWYTLSRSTTDGANETALAIDGGGCGAGWPRGESGGSDVPALAALATEVVEACPSRLSCLRRVAAFAALGASSSRQL